VIGERGVTCYGWEMEREQNIGGVKVRLPEGYTTESSRRYPLLLVLGDIGLDSAAEWTDSLHAEGVIPGIIAAKSPMTICEVSDPKAILATLAGRYRLLEAPAGRWICGTGHDGITALRAVLDHPDLFGRAACLSASFEGTEGAPPLHSPMLRELEGRSSLPEKTRIHFDYGTMGLDECYEPYHRDLASILRGKGWQDEREFRIVRAQGGSHDSASWQNRLGSSLRWLAGR